MLSLAWLSGADSPCVFDLVKDPTEQNNLNASMPAVAGRLLARFKQLSSLAGLAADQQGSGAELLPVVPASTKKASWGSVDVGVCDTAPSGYSGCAKVIPSPHFPPLSTTPSDSAAAIALM